MNISKKLERQLIGLIALTITLLIVGFFNGKDQDKTTEKLKTYLQSPEFIQDFKHVDYNPKQEVLVAYPKITFYLTFPYLDKKQTFSQQDKTDADERQCDFIFNLFQQLKAEKPEKRRILEFLADENIVVENIYRNKYAEHIYTTEIPLKNCESWYPKK